MMQLNYSVLSSLCIPWYCYRMHDWAGNQCWLRLHFFSISQGTISLWFVWMNGKWKNLEALCFVSRNGIHYCMQDWGLSSLNHCTSQVGCLCNVDRGHECMCVDYGWLCQCLPSPALYIHGSGIANPKNPGFILAFCIPCFLIWTVHYTYWTKYWPSDVICTEGRIGGRTV